MDFYYVWTPWGDEPKEQYLWEIFPCTDGILLSKGYVTPKLEENIVKYGGIHEFLRWKGPVIGDSGAWLYKYEDEPPYSVKELLDYYVKLKIPVGAHLDHMILKTIRVDGVQRELTPEEKKKRWEITLDNARETINLLEKEKFNHLKIIGVVQGWDIESYGYAARQLLEMGYDYLGVGGIARKPTSQLLKIVETINEEIDKLPSDKRNSIKLHLFGFARLHLIPYLMKKRIVSFDTAAPLRTAWESGEHNYHFANPWRSYTAIRIRLTRVRKARRELEDIEKETLETMYKYARREMSMEFTLKKLLDYEKKILEVDGLNNEKIEKLLRLLRERYTRTLKDRPWESCSCPVCKEVGVDVIIFREGWRNGSRAHHNVRQFYIEMRNLRNKNRKMLPQVAS
jgi:uncharacterized protein YjiS (DUF1127 family)